MQFKRDKIFEQFIPAIENLNFKEMDLPEAIQITGICKLYQTELNEINMFLFARDHELKLIKTNKKAEQYWQNGLDHIQWQQL